MSNVECEPFEELLRSDDGLTTAWIQTKHHCCVQSSNPSVVRRIKKWSFCARYAYWLDQPTCVFSLPQGKWKWVLKQLGLPEPKKKKGRVEVGKKIGSQNLKKCRDSSGQIPENPRIRHWEN